MKRFLILLAALIFSFAPARADDITHPGGQGPTGTTCLLAAIPATSTQVSLTASSQYITIVNLSATATLYYSPVSPVTITNFPIAPNSAYSYSGAAIDRFWLIGSGTGDNYGVIAH